MASALPLVGLAMSAFSNHSDKQQMLNRVRGEFLEMPGLRLRVEQAQRLWGLDRSTCEELLASLVDAKFLSRRSGGVYGLN
jgi:DNA-binding IclR family transcriptional regulator